MSSPSQLILYVKAGKGKCHTCAGSAKCMSLIRKSSVLQDSVEIQDVNKLSKALRSFPSWLNGTPILVHTGTRQIFRGTEAVEALCATESGPLNTRPIHETHVQKGHEAAKHVDVAPNAGARQSANFELRHTKETFPIDEGDDGIHGIIPGSRLLCADMNDSSEMMDAPIQTESRYKTDNDNKISVSDVEAYMQRRQMQLPDTPVLK